MAQGISDQTLRDIHLTLLNEGCEASGFHGCLNPASPLTRLTSVEFDTTLRPLNAGSGVVSGCTTNVAESFPSGIKGCGKKEAATPACSGTVRNESQQAPHDAAVTPIPAEIDFQEPENV